MRYMNQKVKAVFLALFFVVGFTPASATIINIPDDYATIQAGIDASVDGDTVLVQPGTYVENINFNGHNIVLGSLFLTTGDTSYISQTVIDGDESGSVVTFENGEDSTAVITGFTIQNGFSGDGGGIFCCISHPTISNNIIIENEGIRGGAILCNNSDAIISYNTIEFNVNYEAGGGICCINSNPIIDCNTINNNSSYEYSGGGIYCTNSSPIINNNMICNNYAFYRGGGIYCSDSHPTISNNEISENTAYYNSGGGIFCEDSNPIIGNNTISQNLSPGGSGIMCIGSSPIIERNTILQNHAELQFDNAGMGGGIYCYGNSNPQIINNTIYNNTADFGGGGIFIIFDSNPIIINTIFCLNVALYGSEIYNHNCSLIVNYCDICDTIWPGEGNIDADPMFVDPENDDFHLQSGSPCIDAGDPNSPQDPDSTRADMGAYYFDQTTDIGANILLPVTFALQPNYPNPFNATTVIRYNLPKPSVVTIDIYDILGRKVETLKDEYQDAGHHQVIWQPDEFSTGIYFYKLRAGDYIETKKMMLLK